MKKLLSLLGVTAILTSGGSTLIATKARFTIEELQDKNTINFTNSKNDIGNQINNLKKAYDRLSEVEQKNIAKVMIKLPELNSNEVSQYLANSKIDFIVNNQTTIETMYFLYNSIEKISESLSVAPYSLDIDWSMINQYINLDFGDSNEYSPWTSTYGSDHWWTAVWDWGFRIDFPEGDINVMRVVKLLFSLYNGVDFSSLASLLKSGNTFFDYLINLDDYGEDKLAVLYDIIIKTENDFKNSGVPFTNNVYDIFDKFATTLKPFKEIKLSLVSERIKNAIKAELGMSIEEIGAKYSDILNKTINALNITNNILDLIHGSIPGVVWDYIASAIQRISNEVVNADQNHHGVYIKFQQFLFPQGFVAR